MFIKHKQLQGRLHFEWNVSDFKVKMTMPQQNLRKHCEFLQNYRSYIYDYNC